MAILPLDLTGSLASNKITGEIKTISRDTDRYFVPANGAIYDNNGSFKIYNALSGQRLQPNTQYRLLHLVDEAVKISNKNVYAIIFIVDKTLTSVRYEYQAVGGVYQNIASTVNDKLSEYLLGTTGSNSIGSVVGVPVQLPPEHHLQNAGDFQGAGALVAVLESIRNAILLGNGAAFAAAYEYIDYRFQQSLKSIQNAFAEAESKRLILEEKTQIKNGDYIITTNSANPSTYLGYGNWVLDPNVLLYGADTDESVGNFIDVGVGSGHVAIKRFFWRRDDSTAGASYQLSTSATSVNEGQIVTITLTTSGLQAGTKIAYTITGVSENDMVGTKLNGNFIINAQGVATLPIEIRQDMETEGAEVLRLSLTAMPTVKVDVSINDTSIAATYGLRFSGSANGSGDISSVNEGSKAYLAITTTGVAAGTRVYLLYNDSTVGLDDSESGDWPTYFDVAANGFNVVEYSIKADQLTEGVETLVVNVCTTNNINSRIARSVLTVNDSSRSPSGNLTFASNSSGTAEISQTNEGTTVYLFVNTTNVANGEFIDLAYAGSATAQDFSNALPTRVTINNNQAIVTLNVSADVKTEGDETFVVRALYNGRQITEKTLIIKDTSVNPSYNLKFSTNSSGTDTITRANEGQSVYLYIETSNVADGTVLNAVYTGTVSPSDDFVNYPRSLTVVGNRASGVIIIKADQLSEGEENVIVEIKNGTQTIGTAMLYINDTSASPSASIRFSTVASGSNTITQTNEGSTVFAIIETTNVNNGTVLNVSHTGTATADDFVNARAGTVTINNNVGYVELQVKNDLLTEGQETYRIAASLPNGEVVTSGELTINDTSVPTLNVYFSGNVSGSGQVTSFNEGQTAYLVIETTGIATGTSGVTLTYAGSTTASDIENGNFGLTNVTIQGSRTIIPYVFANDSREDGTKTMTVTVTVPGITGSKQGTVTVNDTSKFGRLTASGNIVVPPGKVARVILLSGTGMAKYDNGGAGYVDVESSMTVDGYTFHLNAGSHGSPAWLFMDSGAIYGAADGTHGTINMYVRNEDEPFSLLNINEQNANPTDRDGIVQLITVMNKHGGDQGLIKTFNMPGLPTAITDIIEAMGNPVAAPQESYPAGNGPDDVVTPGYGSGSPAIVMVYHNQGSTARTIPVNLMNYANPTVSGIRGSNSTCLYELFDTIEQASLHYEPAIIATNVTTAAKNFSWPGLIEPGESYLVTVVSGGGPSLWHWNRNSKERGQNATLWFETVGNANNITISGALADKGGGSAGAGGTIKINGILPGYVTAIGQGGNDVDNYTIAIGPDVGNYKDRDSPIFGYAAKFTVIPTPRQFVTLPWTESLIAYGAPGYPPGGGTGCGGAGRSYTMLITNTTQNAISLHGQLSAYTDNAVNPQAGKPGAIIINRVYLTGKGSTGGTSNIMYPTAAGVTDGSYTVIRGFNLADEFIRQFGRAPNSQDSIILNVPANLALIGSVTSPAGITIDARCNNVSSITIINNGMISGIGGNGGSGTLYATGGGVGIANSSSKSITVRNYGTIAGGGGGSGASFLTLWGGGGGAPYGNGAARTGVSYPEADGKDGTLLSGGESGYYQSLSNTTTVQNRAGPGGTMGNPGSDGKGNQGIHNGGAAGYVKEGLVNITNLGSGVIKGR